MHLVLFIKNTLIKSFVLANIYVYNYIHIPFLLFVH